MPSAWKNIFAIIFIILLTIVGYQYVSSGTSSTETATNSSEQVIEIVADQTISEPEATKNYKIPYLMYHYVEYNQNEEDFLRERINIEPHVFEQQVIDLKSYGFEFVFASTAADMIHKNSYPTGKYVVLTFDDGYRDFYTDVFPILQKHNVKATVYLIPNKINIENYMFDSQIREIANSGLVELGSHTMNHPDLTSLDEIKLKNELLQSKSYIEDRFIVDVDSFAYPNGTYNESAMKAIEEIGYTNAVITENGNTVDINSIYKIPRIRPGYATGKALVQLIEKED